MANTTPDIPRGADGDALEHVAHAAEMRWAWLVGAIIVFLVGMIVYMSVHWAAMPPVRTETIEVAGGEDVELIVRSTRHGPLLSDVDDTLTRVGEVASGPRRPGPQSEETEYAVSLAWTALDPAPTADAMTPDDPQQPATYGVLVSANQNTIDTSGASTSPAAALCRRCRSATSASPRSVTPKMRASSRIS